MDEQFVFAVFADDDEAVVHGRGERFVQGKVQRIGKRSLVIARERFARDMGNTGIASAPSVRSPRPGLSWPPLPR
ncbi:hypothetical protein [Variovorax sp. OV329]|uniref:hypothetical protein n=1 Tax=Variovorax sp. OV329 TaxID=1882825 RepID=UPI001113307E|nr:hypothetical protein [Variovorax sp. OV329]